MRSASGVGVSATTSAVILASVGGSGEMVSGTRVGVGSRVAVGGKGELVIVTVG